VYLFASFLTVHFGEWRQRWHGMAEDSKAGASILEDIPRENEGVFAIFDYASGQCLASVHLDTPAGFVVTHDHVYVNSMYGNRIVCLDRTLRVTDVISARLMSDLHSLIQIGDNLLLTSSGIDAILEMDVHGAIGWTWFARERAYKENPVGFRPPLDRKADYRTIPISTGDQTTHCNSAVPAILDGREVVLATLFHQGELIAIDRKTGSHKVLVTGMAHPHSIRPRTGGWMICDSRSGAVVLLDEGMRLEAMVERDFNWVQDCIELSAERLLIADANNSRLVEWNVPAERQARQLDYPGEWKIYQADVVSEVWSARVPDIVSAVGAGE
jgi:hypothetical protein